MENNIKGTGILWGIIGGGIIIGVAFICALLLTACFMGTSDPNGFVTVIALLSLAVGGTAGGFISGKKGQALTSSAIAAVTALVILALTSLFVPESESVVSRILPPVTVALTPLLGGYLSGMKGDAQKKKIKKAMKRKN